MDLQAYQKEIAEQQKKERAAWKRLGKALNKISHDLDLLWRFGDGEGGSVFNEIISVLRVNGYAATNRNYDRLKGIVDPKLQGKSKKKISHNLRRKVFERDAYRCKHCDAHEDLSVDHIHPESKGGTLDLSNLQTLCRSCNSKKAAKVRDLESAEH